VEYIQIEVLGHCWPSLFVSVIIPRWDLHKFVLKDLLENDRWEVEKREGVLHDMEKKLLTRKARTGKRIACSHISEQNRTEQSHRERLRHSKIDDGVTLNRS
jgi:hypothetical protein